MAGASRSKKDDQITFSDVVNTLRHGVNAYELFQSVAGTSATSSEARKKDDGSFTLEKAVNVAKIGIGTYDLFQAVQRGVESEKRGETQALAWSGARNDNSVSVEKAAEVTKIGCNVYNFCQSVQEGIESAKRGETQEWVDDDDEDPSMEQVTKMMAGDAYRMFNFFFQGEPSRGPSLDNDECHPTTRRQSSALAKRAEF